MKKIVVDAMGSDSAPLPEVKGGVLAVQDIDDLFITFIGNEKLIRSELELLSTTTSCKMDISNRIEVINATETITMHDDPIVALKTKTDSSMTKGILLLKEGNAEAYISAGNTGATMTIATILLGCIEGVTRPTIGVFVPTSSNKNIFLLDVGATLECRSRYLYEYAVMGSTFYRTFFGVPSPLIGMLNIGEEPTKGTKELIEANKKLSNSGLNFFGNIEGGDILSGKTDVVICDGYVGNIILKFMEQFHLLFNCVLDNVVASNTQYTTQTDFISDLKLAFSKLYNPENYGGVPLVGINGNVIIGHGKSTPIAIKNMIMQAISCIDSKINEQIAEELAKN